MLLLAISLKFINTKALLNKEDLRRHQSTQEPVEDLPGKTVSHHMRQCLLRLVFYGLLTP